MGEVREALKPFVGKRVKIRGSLGKFDIWQDRRLFRDIGRACVSSPEMDGVVIAEHVWVLRVSHWDRDLAGSQVEFDALVDKYQDAKLGGTNYCLKNPGQLRILHQPTALRIPEAPVDGAPPDGSVQVDEGERSLPTPEPLDLYRQARAFVKAVGGAVQAAKVVTALNGLSCPFSDIVPWIQVIAEEGEPA